MTEPLLVSTWEGFLLPTLQVLSDERQRQLCTVLSEVQDYLVITASGL